MADGRKQHDWDLQSYSAYYFVAPYQDKDYTIFDLHPAYQKLEKEVPTISEKPDAAKEEFAKMRG